MRRFCVVFIFISIFNGAFSQSRISGNQVTDGQLSNYNQSEQPFIQGNAYSGNLAESAYNYSKEYFQPGVIITKDGDTLSGLVKYDYPVPLDKVSYKANLLGRDSIFSVLEIKSIITQFVYLANIPFAGKEKMMPWLSVGKINLYSNVKYYGTGSADITYVLEKNNQFTYINKKDFKVMMRHVFFDVPDLLEKIGRKGYRFDDMRGIVKEYNKRFQ
ncbi:MAG TPA: hypothetical protein VIJ95_15870 [Hanamia sp.]